MLKWLAAAAAIFLAPVSAYCESTINTDVPVQGPYNAAPIRQNFEAAATDIGALQSLNAGATAPSAPGLGNLWLNTGVTPYILNIRSSAGAQWVPIAAFNNTTAQWIPPVGGGTIPSITSAATTNLGSVSQAAVNVTGSQSIASFGTVPEGQTKFITFTASPTLIYNASFMILPGATNLPMSPGQTVIATSLGGGAWRIMAAGNAIVPTNPAIADNQLVAGDGGVLIKGIDLYYSNLSVVPGVITPHDVPAISASTSFGFEKVPVTALDTASVTVHRNATFTGGAPGSVNAGFQGACYAGAGITSYEWCGLFIMNNDGIAADGAQHNALYAQSIKQSTGATWSGTIELIDKDSTDASSSSVALEVDHRSNGTPANNARVILHLVGTKDDLGGSTPTINDILRLGLPAAYPYQAVYNAGLRMYGDFVSMIDLREATAASVGIWLADGDNIAFDTIGDKKMFWDSGTGCINFVSGGALDIRQQLCETGVITSQNGVVGIALGPVVTTGVLATTTNHDLAFQANLAESLRVLAAGGITLSQIPTSAGAGGLYLCIDTAGVVYKKAACP